jgi:hypothetical protein
VTKVVAPRKKEISDKLSKARGIHMMAEGERLVEKSLVAAKRALQDYTRTHHPQQFAFLPNSSTDTLLRDMQQYINII